MLDFLDRVTERILLNEDELHRVLIVLPSRRAALFLRQKIQRSSRKSLLMPRLIAQEDLMEEISGLYVPERMEILTHMYQEYRKLRPEGDELGRFLQWGSTLLQDFNEIDRNLVDGSTLYRHLFDVKQIEEWDPSGDSGMVAEYLDFWKLMGDLYAQTSRVFLAESIAWQGLAYRQAAERISEDELLEEWRKTYSHIYFAGLNALTRAEETVIQIMERAKLATLFWDYDMTYILDTEHEAGHFARRYLNKKKIDAPILDWVGDHYKSHPKRLVKTYAANDAIGQCKIVQEILGSSAEPAGQETAILLSDEELLIPMLYSIPEHIQDINVTMGMPMKKTSLGQFLLRLIQMHRDSLRRSMAGESRWTYHFKAFIRLLHSPESGRILSPEERNGLLNELNRQIRVQVSPSWIRSQLSEGSSSILADLLDEWKDDPIILLQRLGSFLGLLLQEGPHIEASIGSQLDKLITRLSNLLKEEVEFRDPELLLDLLEDSIRNEKLDLYGEPLKGVQLMGLLESRALDFKRLIILSVNEGILPTGKTVNSFIPFDIKKHYEMPVFVDKDAIFAYHFYRALHRAEEIHLLYHTDHSGLGSGEPSRFIRQIQHEWPGKFVSAVDDVHITTSMGSDSSWNDLNIPKSESVIREIQRIADRGFSPTSLSLYIQDPVEFYFRHILHLKEVEEVEEDLGALTIGKVVHNTLEHFFKTYESKPLRKADIQKMRSELDQALLRSFEKEYNTDQLRRGRNVLVHHAFKELLDSYLRSEELKIQDGTSMIFLKAEARLSIPLKTPGGRTYTLHGQVDRVHEENGQVVITDYKTGGIGNYELSLKSLEEAFEPNGAKAFQLLCYALMHQKSFPERAIGRLKMVSFRNPDAEYELRIDKKGFQEDILERFEELLGELIEKIMDPENPFHSEFDAPYPQFTQLWS